MLAEELKEKRLLAENELKRAKQYKRFITVQSVGVEPLELNGNEIECLKVYFNGVYGYIPKHLMDDYEFRSILSFVDNDFQVMIEEIISDENQTFFVANRKAALEKQAELFWKSAKKGQIVDAFVSGTDKVNVYLIISGVRVRMNREEYSYKYHNDMRTVVAIGQHIEVKIIEIDPEEKKLQVSRRVLEADPKEFLSHYKVGGFYAAEINNIDYEVGVFVTLKPHGITALAPMPSLRIGNLIKVGDNVNFKVTRMDLEKGYVFGHIVVPRLAQIAKAQKSW